MAFFTQNKFNYTTGVPDGNDVYPSVSSTWGDDGAGVLGNGTIAFPTAAGGAGQVLTDVGGTGVLTFADAPSTPPSGILGSVQLSDGAGGFTSDQPSFNYNSTTKRLGVGKVATTSLDVLEDSIGVNAFFENVSGSDFDTAVGLKLKHRTTIDMEATFGIAQEFYLEDDTSGELLAGSVGFERVDSDSERRYVVKGGTNGTQELFSIDSNREFTVEKGLRNGFGVDSLSGVSDDALAWNINDANAAAIIANAGSGIGLRVIANSGNILSLEDTNEVAQVLVSNTGLVTFNDAANATADFEVKAQTSGTALFVDVSTGDLGLGTNTTNPGAFNGRWITMSDADRNGVEMRRTGSDSDGSTVSQIFATAPFISGNSGIIGAYSIATDGTTLGNRGGRITFNVKEDGTSNNHQMRLKQSGLVEIDRGLTINIDGNTSAHFEVKGPSSSTIAYVDVLNRGLGINTNVINPGGFNGKWITMLDTDRNGIEMRRNGSDSDLSTIGQFFGTSTSISGGSGIAGSVFIGTDGATAGNRGGRVGLTSKEDGTSNFHSLIVRSSGTVEVDRGMTLNKDANGAADFEILAETTGTAFKVDVSSGLVTSRKDVTIGEDVLENRTLTIQTGGGRDAILSLTTGIAAGGRNAYTKYTDFGSTIWSVGKQESVSDSFVWSNGSLGTDTRMDLSTSGDLGLFGDLSVNGGAITLNESGPGNNVILSLHSATASSFNTIDQVSDFEGAFHNLKGMHTSGSGKDAATRYFLGGSLLASIGLDGSDSNAFVISRGGSVGTNNFARFDTTTGAIIFNDSASATGDFEVLAETTGTALLVDVSTGWSAFGGASTNLIGIASSRGITVSGPVSSNVAPVMEFYLPDSTDTDGQFIGFNNYVSGDVSSTSGQIGLFGMHLDGGTAGNRGGAFEWRTKKNGLPGLNINLELDNTGALIVNPVNDNFSSFQVNHDTGTILKTDPVAKGISINHTNTPLAPLDIRDNGMLLGSLLLATSDDGNKNLFGFGNATVNADPTFGYRGYITNSGVLNLEMNKVGFMQVNTSGSLAFYTGTTPVAKQTVTGSRGGNAALADLLTKLANTGLITDSTS